MVYFGKLEEKQKAIRLRKQGLSYNEIKASVDVSKDTLSRWCRDVALSPSQLERLQRKRLVGAERGRIVGAKKQQKRKLDEIENFIKRGKRDIGKLSKRERFLTGVAFYFAEGDKSDGKISFANSDPRVIKFMMSWFREICNIPEVKFRGAIWIHEELDKDKAKKYWSEVTGIPKKQFHKTYVVKNKKGSRKIRKKKHRYGIFSIRLSSTKIHRKIMGWTVGILGSKML